MAVSVFPAPVRSTRYHREPGASAGGMLACGIAHVNWPSGALVTVRPLEWW